MLKKETALLLSLLFAGAFLFYLFSSQISAVSEGVSVHPAHFYHAEDARVDINLADAEELQQLPGIGPALAEAIILWREEHGLFRSAEDLLDVPGIGGKTVSGLRDYIITGGYDEDTGS